MAQPRKEHASLEKADNACTHARLGMGPLHSVFCATIKSGTQKNAKVVAIVTKTLELLKLGGRGWERAGLTRDTTF